MELTDRQTAELRYLSKYQPLWRGVPPAKADGDLTRYLMDGLVVWKEERGYLLTDKGMAAAKVPPQTVTCPHCGATRKLMTR
jgi:hypothetical protein